MQAAVHTVMQAAVHTVIQAAVSTTVMQAAVSTTVMQAAIHTVIQAAVSTTVMQAAVHTVMQAAVSTTVMQAAIVVKFCQPDPSSLLLQVVQDFVQQTADEETPTDWLHRIMDTNSREEGDYDINLLGTTRTNTMQHSCSVFLCIAQVTSTMYTHGYVYNVSGLFQLDHLFQVYSTMWIATLYSCRQQESIYSRICQRFIL